MEHSENSKEDSKDEIQIRDAYHQLFEESLRIKNVNKVVLKNVEIERDLQVTFSYRKSQ